jgi:hypothetical protein
MLHRYSFKNFQSFAEQSEVSMLLNGKTPERGWQSTSPSGKRVNTILAVIGANGAGKTVALKPLVFAVWFMTHSFSSKPDDEIPISPHFGSTDPIELELEADDEDGVLWRYTLHANPKQVVRESLEQKAPGERYHNVFVRDIDPSGQRYKVKQQGFGLAPSEAAKVRPNASLISTARQYDVALAKRLTAFEMTTNVHVQGRWPFEASQLDSAAKLFALNEPLKSQMASLLRSWDLGLSDVLLQRFEERDPATAQTKDVWLPFGVHADKNGAAFSLHFGLESNGTQSAFVLLSRVLPVLANGGITVLDELDADLHPHMVEPVLNLFADPLTNPHNAQLIFSAHTTQVLSFLEKSQVLFVEKEDCQSTTFRADTIKGLRADDNLFAKYMAGALGAVPQF